MKTFATVSRNAHSVIFGINILRIMNNLKCRELELRCGLYLGFINQISHVFKSRDHQNNKKNQLIFPHISKLDKLLNALGYQLVILRRDEPTLPPELESEFRKMTYIPETGRWYISKDNKLLLSKDR